MEEYGWLALPALLLLAALALRWRARARRAKAPAAGQSVVPAQATPASDPFGADTEPNPRVLADIAAAVEAQRQVKESRAAQRLAADQARALKRARAEADDAAA